MESLASIFRLVLRKNYMVSLNLKDAFMQILIHNSSRSTIDFTGTGPAHLHQSSQTDIEMGEDAWNANHSVLKLPNNHRRNERSVPSKQGYNKFQVGGTRIQNQGVKVHNYSILIVNHL
ncbi:hypothetical protein AYI68_g4161 [Smittium mucronatum]|uniref:Uncharacterized protein n=1 Tax=Smittium mucronatum TaxID=133383 RepID=A0A1R0GXW0_9FUNG|nr:hypothetical protein AYI68_g4161 [Smittium mucronatum]